jgi:hypothetical protein
MRNPCLEIALRELEAVGIRDVEQVRGGKHWQLRWQVNEHGLRVYTIPGTPGDWRSPHNVRAEIRRMLREDGLLVTTERPEPAPLHAMDYLVYAHLQLAHDKEASAVVDEMIEVKGYNPNVRTGPYAVAASQARYVLERSDWKGAAGLQVQPTQFAYVDAVTHFARALGAARFGNPDSAAGDIAKLAELREKLRPANDSYWTEQVDIHGRSRLPGYCMQGAITLRHSEP